jgi:hypothetical protein
MPEIPGMMTDPLTGLSIPLNTRERVEETWTQVEAKMLRRVQKEMMTRDVLVSLVCAKCHQPLGLELPINSDGPVLMVCSCKERSLRYVG